MVVSYLTFSDTNERECVNEKAVERSKPEDNPTGRESDNGPGKSLDVEMLLCHAWHHKWVVTHVCIVIIGKPINFAESVLLFDYLM